MFQLRSVKGSLRTSLSQHKQEMTRFSLVTVEPVEQEAADGGEREGEAGQSRVLSHNTDTPRRHIWNRSEPMVPLDPELLILLVLRSARAVMEQINREAELSSSTETSHLSL